MYEYYLVSFDKIDCIAYFLEAGPFSQVAPAAISATPSAPAAHHFIKTLCSQLPLQTSNRNIVH
jgi:hypothetical protein